MRLVAVLALAFLACQPALGQTPAQKPTAPTKPSVIQPSAPRVTVATTPASGQMELLCRNPGIAPPGSSIGHSQTSMLTYERVSVRDAAGAIKTMYVPVDATLTLQFTPATGLAGARGEALAEGSCGLRASVIAPVAGSPSMRLTVSSPPSFILTATDDRSSRGHFAGSSAALSLPPCPSGVRSFTVNRTGPAEFFLELLSPGKSACAG